MCYLITLTTKGWMKENVGRIFISSPRDYYYGIKNLKHRTLQ